jgi:Rieske Fe-S protein
VSEAEEAPAGAPRSERRGLLKLAVGAIGAALSAAVAAPVLALLSHPLLRREERDDDAPLAVARLDELPEGVPTRAEVVAPTRRDSWARYDRVPLGAVWLVRRGPSVRALSTTCPHAGCYVDYAATTRAFACPCHGSAFDVDGRCTGGPSPRAMDELEAFVDGNEVRVRFQRFRLATRDKEPA